MADNNSNNNNVNKGNMGNQAPRFNGYNNFKNNLAKGAATAVGGPAAGKAVDTLNKVKNNPNNGYLNNKNRGNREAAGSGSQLGDDASSVENTNQQKSSMGNQSPLGGLSNILGGNKSTKINEDDSPTTKAIKTAIKVKKAMPIIAALAPILGAVIGVVTVVVIIMSQFAAIENFVAQISVGVEKMLNFVTGDGWMTNEDSFFKVLEDENKRYKKFSNNNENLDIPLIAATIHYDRVVDISTYEKEDAGNESYDPTSQDTSIIKSEETASFYGVATDFLGKINSLVIGNKKLLGHLVKTEVEWRETTSISDVKNGWETFFTQIGYVEEDTAGKCDSLLPQLCVFRYSQQFIKIYKNWMNYTVEYDDALAYPMFSFKNQLYELEENVNGFANIFNGSNAIVGSKGDNESEEDYVNRSYSEAEGSGWLKYPVVTYSMDYEGYKKYLKEVFIPFTLYKDATIDDEINREIDTIIDEIFAQRDYYNYLFHNESEDGTYSTTGGVCSYNIGSTTASNIKVELLSCDSDASNQTVLETIDFDKYIMGVVYGEIDYLPDNPETMKAQAIAVRSYTLTRQMCKGKNCWVGYNSDTNTIRIRSCTKDQVYCDYEKGCTIRKTLDGYQETRTGLTSGNKVYKRALSETDKANFEAILSEVNGKVVVNNDNIKNTSYTNVRQESWKSLENQGLDYNEILVKTYGKNVTIESNCTTGTGAMDGEWANWKQCNMQWGSNRMGSATICKSGCLVTSIAIQIARSNTKLTVSEFNPAIFVDNLNRNGGFSGANFQGIQYQTIAPNAYVAYRNANISGSITSKASKIKSMINDGCYVVLRVKMDTSPYNGQHWVAVIDVDDNNNILIVDPGGGPTGVHILNSQNHPKYNILWNHTTATASCYKFK